MRRVSYGQGLEAGRQMAIIPSIGTSWSSTSLMLIIWTFPYGGCLGFSDLEQDC